MYSVLLVDDCSADIEGLIETIDWKGLNCHVTATARDGSEGIEMAKELRPDIIITDVSMPKLDGIAMTKEIRSFMPQVSFIYISCFDEFSYVKSAMDQNVSAYVLKPIKIPELEQAILKITTSLAHEQQYRKLSKHVGSLAENFLSDLLLGSDYDAEYALLLGISHSDRFRMALFEYDDYSSASEIYLELSKLKAMCISLTASERNYFLEFGVSTLVCLIHEETMSKEQFDSFVSKIKANAPYNQKLLISSHKEALEPDRISEVYRSLSLRTNVKFPAQSSIDLHEKLCPALLSGTEEDIKALVDKLLPQKLTGDLNYSKAMSVQIISIVTLILNENNASYSDIFDDEFLIWNKLSNFRDDVNVRQLINNLLVSAQSFLAAKSAKLDKYDSIATDIKKYIDRNFPSPTIVEDVAQAVHLSVNHTNSIFKKVTGQTLFNYTVSCRIERAKLLMSDRALSISDIATAVGYVNNAHFATAFKKNTGLSPSQYRNSHGY